MSESLQTKCHSIPARQWCHCLLSYDKIKNNDPKYEFSLQNLVFFSVFSPLLLIISKQCKYLHLLCISFKIECNFNDIRVN
ncbi:hypothetical protein T12_16292 [Trichinella patagoniensis]|uniref:Uncharacterized protein n=1 Tax=Trichinella patagoniensis TaxID=990121 RepID=A0A0V1ADI8_9BILA|nr:hypothetical protein T12_16292 [Trichinella patagoniensis]